jgi:hypothetical protein
VSVVRFSTSIALEWDEEAAAVFTVLTVGEESRRMEMFALGPDENTAHGAILKAFDELNVISVGEEMT